MEFNGHYHLKANLLQWPRFYFLVKLHSLILVDYSFSIKKSQLTYKNCKQNMDNVDLIIKKRVEMNERLSFSLNHLSNGKFMFVYL